MATLIPSNPTTDPLNPHQGLPSNPSLPWWNATKGIKTASPTLNAIICPPGGTVYYEYGDPNGELCLTQQGPSKEPDSSGPKQPPVPYVLVPTITRSTPPEPSNSKRAVVITDTFETNLPAVLPWSYSIGVPHNNTPIPAIIRNNCINSELEITISRPPYISVDIANTVIIPPITTLQIEVSFNEDGIKQLGKATPRLLEMQMEISVKPLNSSSHIYVQVDQEIGDVTLPPPIVVSQSLELKDVLLPSPIIVNSVI